MTVCGIGGFGADMGLFPVCGVGKRPLGSSLGTSRAGGNAAIISVSTEMSNAMSLSPTAEQFILHWGEMGSRWGVNRTQAQIHALLYLAEHPLTAEQIAEALAVARSNVSTSLKELQSWGLIMVRHIKGDRRDHFSAEKDLWKVMQLIVDGRKKREIDPTLAMLRATLQAPDDADPATLTRLTQLLEFMEQLIASYEQLKHLPPQMLMIVARLAGQMMELRPNNPAR